MTEDNIWRRGFLDLPFEIVEMIFGRTRVIDLTSLLKSSSCIQNMFGGTPYVRQLDLILRYESRTFKELYRYMSRNPHLDYCVHDVLLAFTKAHCECGNYGFYILWIVIPCKKLCGKCLVKPQYQCNDLNAFLANTDLTEEDVRHIPTITVSPLFPNNTPFQVGTVLASQAMIESVTKLKSIKFTPPPHVYRHEEASLGPNEIIYTRSRPGASEITSLDVKTGKAYFPLQCKGCPDDGGTTIPHNYEALHAHIASFHPEYLTAFEIGWDRLTPQMKRSWLQKGQYEDVPHYLRYEPHDGIFKSWEQNEDQERLRRLRWFQFGTVVVAI